MPERGGLGYAISDGDSTPGSHTRCSSTRLSTLDPIVWTSCQSLYGPWQGISWCFHVGLGGRFYMGGPGFFRDANSKEHYGTSRKSLQRSLQQNIDPPHVSNRRRMERTTGHHQHDVQSIDQQVWVLSYPTSSWLQSPSTRRNHDRWV